MKSSPSLRAAIVLGIGALAGSMAHAPSQSYPVTKAIAQRSEAGSRMERRNLRRMGSGFARWRNKHRETMAQQQRRSRKNRNRARHKARVQGR